MENASKALLIAGGILLAILILGLLALLLSSLSSNQLAEEKKTEAKQLQEFNQQWEAYNKKALFGSDIITVVNKAIQNNKSAETMDEKNKFYVNVTIDCKNTTFDTKITKIDLKTGRPHQIRVQFASRKHPLFGDQRYGQNVNKVGQQIALWSYKLEIIHPTTKEKMEFTCEPPKEYPWNLF